MGKKKKTTQKQHITLLSKQIPHATSVLKWLIRLPSETSAVKQILYTVEHRANPNWGNVQYMMGVCGAIIPALITLRNIRFDVFISPLTLFRNTWMADLKEDLFSVIMNEWGIDHILTFYRELVASHMTDFYMKTYYN